MTRNARTRFGVRSVLCGTGWAFLAIVGITSCGSENAGWSPSGAPAASSADAPVSTDTSPESATAAPPATTLFPAVTYLPTTVADSNAPIGPPPTGPVILDESERCSLAEPAALTDSTTDYQPMLDESARLEPMLGTVVNYGGQHPGEFGGYGLFWQDAADASVFAMFTDHVPDHRAALAEIVSYPDELIVCQSALSEAQSRGLQSLLFDELNGRFHSLGASYGSVAVYLKASEEHVAADLEQRFGDAVTLRVGNLPYPLAADQRSISTCERDVAGPTETDAGIRASLTFGAPSVPSRIDADATVTVTNGGAEAFTLTSGSPLVGVIVEPATMRAVAVFDGGIAGVGVGVGATLQPGESYDIPVLIGTASCDPTLGYTLPPGVYDVVVPVIVTHGQTPTESVNQLVARATFEITSG